MPVFSTTSKCFYTELNPFNCTYFSQIWPLQRQIHGFVKYLWKNKQNQLQLKYTFLSDSQTWLTLKTLGVWKDRRRRERKTRCLSDLFSFTCTRHSWASWHTTSSKCWVFGDPNAFSFTSTDTVCTGFSTPSPSTPLFSLFSGLEKQILTDFFFWVCFLFTLSGWRITWRHKVKWE